MSPCCYSFLVNFVIFIIAFLNPLIHLKSLSHPYWIIVNPDPESNSKEKIYIGFSNGNWTNLTRKIFILISTVAFVFTNSTTLINSLEEIISRFTCWKFWFNYCWWINDNFNFYTGAMLVF